MKNLLLKAPPHPTTVFSPPFNLLVFSKRPIRKNTSWCHAVATCLRSGGRGSPSSTPFSCCEGVSRGTQHLLLWREQGRRRAEQGAELADSWENLP
jgi:hypothetical protein